MKAGRLQGSVFTPDDVTRAERWLDAVASRPIIRAIRFRNALQAFVRGVGHAEGVLPPVKLMAVDTTEVVALTGYSDQAFRSFSFDTLLAGGGDDGRSGRLRVLDGLINQHLMSGRGQRFLLLTPYAEEVEILRQGKARHADQQIQRIQETPFALLNPEQRRRIGAWFEERRHSADLDREWRDFKARFLPDLTDQMLDRLLAATREAESLDAFIRHARFMLVRPAGAGERSLVTALEAEGLAGFRWDAYLDHCRRPEVLARAKDIVAVVGGLLGRIRQGYKTPDVAAAASLRDAQAFAAVDLLNRFFAEHALRARVDLVGRSPSLHDVIASLPDGAVHVTVRHPLFLPDIYEFDRLRLNRLRVAFLRMDAALASAIDIDSLHAGGRDGAENEETLIEEVRKAAFDVVDVLEGALTVRQALESRTLNSAAAAGEGAGVWRRVTDFFALVERGGPDGEDLFSLDLFRQLVHRNRALADFARDRVFGGGDGESLDLRIIDFFEEEEYNQRNSRKIAPGTKREPRRIEGFALDAMMMVRASAGGFRRAFHIHSGRVARLVRGSVAAAAAGGARDQHRPVVARVPIATLFENLDAALGALSRRKTEEDGADDDVVFNLDATLIVCIAFAGRDRYDTAIALASTVLHRMTSDLRRGASRGFDTGQLRERLAYRELFLFRHYCERALARRDFFTANRRVADSKGSVAKNIARAQRDLDFAALMSEDAERCQGTGVPSPAGERALRDGRLKLAHLGMWIDQILIALEAERAGAEAGSREGARARLYRERIDVFTAAGLVKEISLAAWAAGEHGRGVADGNRHAPSLRRYFAHLEARGLQGALTVFLLFLAHPLSPPLHRLWLGDTSLEPERILVFREWESWYGRYVELVRTHSFSMRIHELIVIVCSTLQEAAALPAGHGSARDPERLGTLLRDCHDRLRRCIDSCGQEAAEAVFAPEPDGHFIALLARELAQRVSELPAGRAP